MTNNTLNLYRGFTVQKLSLVAKRGFSIKNPKTSNAGESNWPGGLSLGRFDAFDLAQDIAKEHGGIPVSGRITVSEEILRQIPLIGIRRILDFSEGMTPGSIDNWRCLTWEDLMRAGEFTIQPEYLTPKWLTKMEAAVSLKEGEYKPFNEFKTEVEGNKTLVERILRR